MERYHRFARLLPFVFIAGFVSLGRLDAIREQPPLLAAFLWTGAGLLAWTAWLFALAAAGRRRLEVGVALRAQHGVQACAQAALFLYWGWYWPEVYAAAGLIAGQLLFAYAFDMLLAWSRNEPYALGFGPFPIVFSINLFLWFRPAWFSLQLLLVALGFVAKAWVRWKRDGRLVHVFNPSSYPLAVFSLGLLLTGSSAMTWGQEIASTQFYPPHIYLVVFLVSLPGQLLFGVTSMTLAAVLTTYLFGLAYFAATGVYFFFDSYIPIAVFIGMHLLFTDPSTSPRTELGRVLFGALYGLSTIAAFEVLGSLGLPTFYDKLLPVPVLNLSVRLLDRAARAPWARRFDPSALGRALGPRQRRVAYASIWTLVFAGMSGVQGVGDGHAGQWLPFWRDACSAGRRYACGYLEQLESGYCDRGSGWACNALALDLARRRAADESRSGAAAPPSPRDVPANVLASLRRGCLLGFAPACANLRNARAGGGFVERGPPTLEDYPVILRGSKGPIRDRAPAVLYARACAQGWPEACRGLAEEEGSRTLQEP